jgi:NitT/TauT family transport system substrate-binding protein
VAGNEEFLAAEPEAVACFIRASIRGWQDTFADPAAAVADTMTYIPEGSIPEPHQQGAIHSVLPIVGSGADDATLLQPTPEKYQSTVDALLELGYLEGEIDVAATYDSSFYDAAVGS